MVDTRDIGASAPKQHQLVSPITGESIASSSIKLSEVEVDKEGNVYWIEGRPVEAGRHAIVTFHPSKSTGIHPLSEEYSALSAQNSDCIPNEVNSRTRVHEYGGGSYLPLPCTHEDKSGSSNRVGPTLVTCNFQSQHLLLVENHDNLDHNEMDGDSDTKRGTSGHRTISTDLTPGIGDAVFRYADFSVDPIERSYPAGVGGDSSGGAQHRLLFAVREDHTDDRPSHVVNTVVCFPILERTSSGAAGSEEAAASVSTSTITPTAEQPEQQCDHPPTEHSKLSSPICSSIETQSVLANAAADPSFMYACPRVDHHGQFLAYVQWRHPNMPWDSSQLVVARLAADGRSVLSRQVVAGGDGGGGVGGESVMTPTWHTPSSATVNGKNSGGYGEEEGGGGDEDSHLFFISDRADGFWAIHRVTISRSPEDAPSSSGAFTVGTIQCVLKCSGYEFGAPQWVFGVHSFRQLPDGRLVTFWTPPTLTPPYAADNSDAKSSAALMDADADATETTGARGRASADANQLYAVVFDGFHSEPFDLSHFDLASLASLPGLHVIPVPGIASPSPGAAGNSGTPTDRTIGIDSAAAAQAGTVTSVCYFAVHPNSGALYLIGGSPAIPAGVFEWPAGWWLPHPPRSSTSSHGVWNGQPQLQQQQRLLRCLCSSSSLCVDPAFVSRPQRVVFPTEVGGQPAQAYGMYYPPCHPALLSSSASPALPPPPPPPLLVKLHGGPTGQARTIFRLDIQFFTSRGFAVLDVDYGGSSGYGRAYRERLKGQWGQVDVLDCCRGAEHLVRCGIADPLRLAIDGGSAGGFTALACATFHDTFKAATSFYGIGDLCTLAAETHKFESRYIDGLIGPYPEQKVLFEARSPINHVHRISCPLLLLHGDLDKVVPPNQAQDMYAAVAARGLPAGLLIFHGEAHGWRKAETICSALHAELSFYVRVFGLQQQVAPQDLRELPLVNAEALP